MRNGGTDKIRVLYFIDKNQNVFTSTDNKMATSIEPAGSLQRHLSAGYRTNGQWQYVGEQGCDGSVNK